MARQPRAPDPVPVRVESEGIRKDPINALVRSAADAVGMSPQILPIAASAEALLDKAKRCRRLARQSTDPRSTAELIALADECEKRAAELATVLRQAVA